MPVAKSSSAPTVLGLRPAGWDSTFLDATQVHRLLQVVLGPASVLTGLSLPDVAHLAQLRFSASPGENAGPWIHLLAVTIGPLFPMLVAVTASSFLLLVLTAVVIGLLASLAGVRYAVTVDPVMAFGGP